MSEIIKEAKEIVEAWNVLGIAEDMENGWERDVMISVVKLFFTFITTIESQKEEIEKLRMALQNAADDISSLISEYPNEMWMHSEKQRWVDIGNDGIAAINNSLSHKQDIEPDVIDKFVDEIERVGWKNDLQEGEK